MGTKVTISIDNREIHTEEGFTILKAADAAGIYIPRLCDHPDLPPGSGTEAESRVYRCGEINGDSDKTYEGCNLCIVEIEGRGITQSCATPVEDGMVIHSNTATLKESRRNSLAQILSLHPHACILCSERDGCDRGECPQGEVKEGRCCPKFDDCEFRKVCEYVTIREDVSQYVFADIPIVETPFFTFDPNLCIGCTRCIRACEKMQGKSVIGFTYSKGNFVVGTLGPSHKESGCVFCGACVTVCPTGALMEKDVAWKKKEKLTFSSVIYPPEDNLEFSEENILKVPEESGVYRLLDEKLTTIYIRGVDNMRRELLEKLQSVGKACYFQYEEHDMYSIRENEVLGAYLKKHGALPEVNNEIDDLY